MEPESLATIFAGSPRIRCRDNVFLHNGIAIDQNNVTDADATLNFWGHSTGPYHPIINPLGLGDRVGDNINFSPWYTDTLFFNDSEDPFIPHPSHFTLSVYPNPFDSSAKIIIKVPEPMIVKVELFDLLGRKLKEMYNAPIAREKEISFTADNLSSGVYFIRAMDTIQNRPFAAKKLLLMK